MEKGASEHLLYARHSACDTLYMLYDLILTTSLLEKRNYDYSLKMRKKRPRKIKKIVWNIKHGAMAYTRIWMKLKSWLFPLDQADLQKMGKLTQPSNCTLFIFPDENTDL